MKEKKKQLQITVIAVSVTIISFLVIIGSIVYLTDRSSDAGMLTDTLTELDRSVKTQEDIMQSMIEISRLNRDKGYAIALDDVTGDHRKSMAYIKTNISFLRNSRSAGRQAVFITAAVMASVSLFLFFFLRWAIDRATAPLHLFHGHVRDILDGKTVFIKQGEASGRHRELNSDLIRLQEAMEKSTKASAKKKKSDKT